jgi:predicted ABC-type ATPase
MNDGARPRLIIVAGPNGSGKTSITQQLLMHEWMGGCVYVNPGLHCARRLRRLELADRRSFRRRERATEIREHCLEHGRSLAFETVLSAPDKLDFIRRAREAGFFIRLFFVGTDDPSINAKRVAMRVMEGGHDVPIPKIIARYTRSLAYCYFVAWLADRTYLYDNSVDDSRARLLFRASEGRLVKTYGEINPWAREIAQRLLPVLSDDTPPSPAVASGLS